MKKQQSSFHMNNEFNGFGEIRYLKGTQQEYYPTVSQENIHPSLDVGNYLLKVIGSVPLVIQPAGVSMCLRKLAGALASVNQVIVSENENHNGYQCNFVLAKPYDITDGSYSCFIPKEYNILESAPGISDHWIAGGEPEGKIWQYYQNGKLLKSTWISENGKN